MTKKRLLGILSIYLFLMIIIPKNINNIFGVIPIRLLLSSIVILSCGIYFIKNKPKDIFGKKYIIFYILFLLFTLPSFFVTKSLNTTLYTFAKFLITFLLFICVLNLKLSKTEIQKLSKITLISISLVLAYGFIQYIFDINLFKVGSYNYPGAKGRISSTFFNTIYFGIFLNIIIALISYGIYKFKDKKIKVILSILFTLSYTSLLLTFTRSAIIIFVGCLIVTLLVNRKVILNKVCLPLYIGTIALCMLIPGVKSLYSRTFTDVELLITDNLLIKFLPNINLNKKHLINDSEITEYVEDPSLNSRIEFSKIGNTIAKDHLGTGIGFGSYQEYMYSKEYATNYPDYAKYKTFPHSTMVLMYAEVSILSVIAFIGFFLVIIFDLIYNWFKYYKKDKRIKELCGVGLTILAGFIVVNIIAENAVYDSQIFPIFLFIMAIIVGYINSLKKKMKED